MRLTWLAFLLVVWGNFAQAKPENVHPWQQMAKMDLAEIKQTIELHHVGPVDPLNPDYQVWLQQGYQQAIKKVTKIKTYSDYLLVLQFYIDGFSDGHIALSSYLERSYYYWPEFVAELKGDALTVSYVKNHNLNIMVGDRINSCDNQAIQSLLQDRVLNYHGIDGIDAEPSRHANKLFFTSVNQFHSLLKSCEFTRDGSTFSEKINWQRIKRSDWQQVAEQKVTANFELVEFANNKYRISLPSFNLAGQEQGIQLLLEQIEKQQQQLLKADAIVFDMRGNQGGSSGWAVKVVDTLFGENTAMRADKISYQGVDWRVSDENIESQQQWADYWLKQEGKDGQRAQYYHSLVSQLRQAKEDGKPLMYRQRPQRERAPLTTKDIPPQVYLFTDHGCFSACLDMADIVMSMPNAIHLGLATMADAVYIDNRSIRLPSGNGRFSFSMKAYRGRYRGHNQPYIPSVVYPSNDMSSQAVDAWLTSQLK